MSPQELFLLRNSSIREDLLALTQPSPKQESVALSEPLSRKQVCPKHGVM